MSLIEHTLFGIEDKVEKSIQLLRDFEPPEGYWVGFSGGKDSCCVLELVKMSGVQYDAHFNYSVEPPELIRFIKTFPEVQIHKPEMTMWQLIAMKGFPPSRMIRYCCSYLKERGGENRRVVTGVRAEESPKRAMRGEIHECFKSKHKVMVNPIFDWSTDDVWAFIHQSKLPYCSLYNEGWKRLGCVMCCMTSPYTMKMEAERWPRYKALYIKAFDRAIENNLKRGKACSQKTGLEMYEWWVSGKGNKKSDTETFMFE
jgi:phosphoadenosine phosphosulfate reductase